MQLRKYCCVTNPNLLTRFYNNLDLHKNNQLKNESINGISIDYLRHLKLKSNCYF